MNGKRGFTLVECAVAVALITVMMLAAFSTAAYAVNAQEKYGVYSIALNRLECLLICFKSGNFEVSAQFLTGCPVPEDGVFFFKADGSVSTADNYSWRIEVTTEGDSFMAVIYDSGGDVIYEMPEAYIRRQ